MSIMQGAGNLTSFDPDLTVRDHRHAVNSRSSVGPVSFAR